MRLNPGDAMGQGEEGRKKLDSSGGIRVARVSGQCACACVKLCLRAYLIAAE